MAFERRKREARPKEKKSDFEEQVVDIRRVTRVMAGGKRFRFRTTVIIGDGKGRVGVGIAKGLDVESSISKAKAQAKGNLINVDIKDGTIPHEVKAKYSAAKVLLKPASPGHGLLAGGSPRLVLRLAGVKDVTAKCLGNTTNKLTNALATVEALKKLKKRK